MTKFNPAPKWPKTLRQYIVHQLATWKPYKDIWTAVTAPDFSAQTGIPALDPEIHGYDAFRMRCKRIPKNEIALAHEEWQREIGAIKWAEDKARIQGLSDLIDKVNQMIEDKEFNKDTFGTAAALVGQLRSLYEQVRKEVQADLDREALTASGTRILLANPKNVQLDTNYVSELLLMYRSEIGGLHNLDLTALTQQELEQLRDRCQAVLDERIQDIQETEFTNEDNDDNV